MDWGSRITYLAATSFKGRVTPFGIRDADRLQHLLVSGKVGSGRAHMLARMALQDIERGIGTVIVDATGVLTQLILERLPSGAEERVIYLDAADAEYPFSWDVAGDFRTTARGRELYRELLASLYGVPEGPLVSAAATYTMENPHTTPLMLHSVVTDAGFRSDLKDSDRDFSALVTEDADAANIIADTGRYLAKDTMVRNLIGQRSGKFSFDSLRAGRSIILDVSRIRIFPTRITPLVRLGVYAARVAAAASGPHALYLHDCLRYLSVVDVERMLSDRSIAVQIADTAYREGDLPIREQAIARSGSIISFQPHPADLKLAGSVVYPYLTEAELEQFEPGECAVSLMIDGIRSKPFIASALQLPERTVISPQDIALTSRREYATPRTEVDESFRSERSRPAPPAASGGPGFSDAFRSMFAKKAGQAPPPQASVPREEKQPRPPTAPPAASPQASGAPSQSPKEVPERELRDLMYVAPIPA